MNCNVRRYVQKFDSDVKKELYKVACCLTVKSSNNDKSLLSKDDKQSKYVNLGDVQIIENEYGYFRASIEVDDTVYEAVFKDILKAYGFLVQTKTMHCKGRSDKEKPLTHPVEDFYFSMGKRKNGFHEFYGKAMGRRFLLVVKDKAAGKKLLSQLATIESRLPIPVFISQASRQALEFLDEDE